VKIWNAQILLVDSYSLSYTPNDSDNKTFIEKTLQGHREISDGQLL